MRRLVVAAAGLAAGIGLLVSVPGFAADANPADAMLDRAREALRTQEFSGRVRLEWRDGSRRHVATVDVATTDGVLQVAGGRVVEHDGRSWMRTGHRWTTLWGDDRDPGAPSISAKYRTRVQTGPTVAGRATRELVVRRADHVVERIVVDRRYGFVLARERYDETGRPDLAMRFVSLRAVHARATVTSVPTVGTRSPTPMRAPADAHRHMGDGFVLVEARRVTAHEEQLRYSDGVFDASIFTRDGALDWQSLPDGGRQTEWDGVKVRRYVTAAGAVVVWQSGDRTLTCVTDAPRRDQLAIVADLTRGDDSGWSDVVRFVIAPFGWT